MNTAAGLGPFEMSSSLFMQSRWVDQDYLLSVRTLAYRSGCVIERDGFSVFTIGCALEFELPSGIANEPSLVSTILKGIESRSQPSEHRPVALAAFPYDLDSRAAFTVAEITVVERAGNAPYAVFMGTQEALEEISERDLMGEVARRPSLEDSKSPEHFHLDPVIGHEQFRAKVAAAVVAIDQAIVQKVVLAREVVVVADRPFLQHELFGRLRALHPSCLSFAIHGFVGATPELLVRKTGSESASTPLAGTMARSGDPEEDRKLADALMASSKERREHQYVVEAIYENLRSFTNQVLVPDEPHILELRNVVHLATTIIATQIDPVVASLEVACKLHPSPAICGTPRATAKQYIEDHEGLSRDLYAGLVGFTDSSGDGEWWIGIRSAMIVENTARIFAGVGIVADSDPAAEFAETQLKLQAMLAVLVRP